MRAESATSTCVHWPGRVTLPVHGFGGIFISLAFAFTHSRAMWLLGLGCLAALSFATRPFCHRTHTKGLKKVREEIPHTPASLLPKWVSTAGGGEEKPCKNTVVKAVSK